MSDPVTPDLLLQQAKAALAHGDGMLAVQSYQAILDQDPGHEEALFQLAQLAHQAGRPDLSLAYLEQLCNRITDNPAYWFSYGSLCLEQRQMDMGEQALRKAIELDPKHLGAHVNLGNRLKEAGQLEEAVGHYRIVLDQQPDSVEILSNLASTLTSQGLHAEAARLYDRIAQAAPDLHVAQSNRLMNMNYMQDLTPGEIFTAHQDWGRNFPDPGPAEIRSRQGRKLHIGYLSPDLRSHPVFWFLHALLTHYDRDQVTVSCFSNLARGDGKTAVLRELSDNWHEVYSLTDDQLADLIRTSGVDILVDLAGHTANNRLTAMAMRPAPVQMTWLGYPNSTGLAQMDYRITDAISDPDGAEDFHSEDLIRLEDGFLCYSPPQDAPDPGPLPCEEKGHITFGSFNNLAKLTQGCIESWSDILRQLPDARLLLKARSMDDPGTRKRVFDQFANQGIPADRLDLRGRLKGAWDHLDLYNQVDIALDTFPYNGTTTTCEALWMGVPVLTFTGASHAGRVSASLLSRVGLSDLVASDRQAMVRMAVNLAGDRDRLVDLKQRLRPRMAASPLCDGPGFARQMEQAMKKAFDRHFDAAQHGG